MGGLAPCQAGGMGPRCGLVGTPERVTDQYRRAYSHGLAAPSTLPRLSATVQGFDGSRGRIDSAEGEAWYMARMRLVECS